jgi:MYXO-CTERM domain-containing protein
MTSTRIELSKNRVFTVVLAATLAFLSLAAAANAVTLRASSVNVSGAGETATICVDVETEGEQVAGTQNELVWDTNCATLSGLGSCRASQGHGKDLHASFPNGDGLPPLRAFVFSMKNVGPMSDGELYCCDFTSELVSAGSCTVSVQGARASDPTGKALSATGVGGAISRGGAASGGGGGGGGIGGPVSGGVTGGGGTRSGATTGGATGAGPTGAGAQSAGGGAGASGGVTTGLGQPPSQVLPGGVPGERPADTELLAEAARDTARQEAERIIEQRAPAAEEEDEEVEPTEEPTPRVAPPTSPAPQATTPARGTPTAKAPTAARTPAAPAAAAEAPKKEESSGWFGCQVTTTGGADGSLFLLVGIAGVLVNRMRRRRMR